MAGRVTCPKCGHSNSENRITCKACRANLRAALSGIESGTAAKDIVVTTGDVRRDYDILGPVYFQVSNKGLLSSALSRLVKHYREELAKRRKDGQISEREFDWGFLYGEWSVGATDFDKAFFIAVEELKKRAAMLGADAIIHMRQDIDLDTTAFQFFYLQMYGTAVKFREESQTES